MRNSLASAPWVGLGPSANEMWTNVLSLRPATTKPLALTLRGLMPAFVQEVTRGRIVLSILMIALRVSKFKNQTALVFCQ